MASPAFRAAGTVLQVTATGDNISGSVSLPAGTTNGDFLLLVIKTLYANSTPTPPAGWTAITSFQNTSVFQNDLLLYCRIASGEPPSYTVTNNGNSSSKNQFVAQILGWDSGTFDASATWAASGASTTIACPTVTAAAGNSTLICVYGQQGNGSMGGPYTPPSGMTERADEADTAGFSDRASYGVADKALSSSGATGTQNAIATSSTPWHMAVSLVIAGSGGGGGATIKARRSGNSTGTRMGSRSI